MQENEHMKEYKIARMSIIKSDCTITNYINELVKQGWIFVKMQPHRDYVWLTFGRDFPDKEDE